MVLTDLGPPNSPPTEGLRLIIRMAIASKASIQKIVTENPKLQLEYELINFLPMHRQM